MLNEKQKEQLERIKKQLVNNGVETFEEMVLYLGMVADSQRKTIEDLKKETEDKDLLIESLKSDSSNLEKRIVELREENDEAGIANRKFRDACQRMEARIWELEEKENSESNNSMNPTYTINFNGTANFGHVESNYRKGDNNSDESGVQAFLRESEIDGAD